MKGRPVPESATAAFAAMSGPNAPKNISFGRIEQRTTPGSIAHVLRAAILDGTLEPGSRLREIPLAADLGVSRAPLRQALGILADEGLIVKYPYRGAFVAKVSATAMSEIASLRIRLEPYAIELAIPRLTGTGRIRLTRALEEMAAGAANNDLTATIDAHMAFHRAFYDLSEHTLLLDLWKSWEAQLQMFFSADHQAFADLHDMVADHERLLSIIDRGDLDEITREIAVHVHSPSPAEVAAEAIASADAQGRRLLG
jgi:DNA-binding GntR family transcriptional regulator